MGQRAYYTFNKSNAGGSTSGDTIYIGQETISISSSVGFTEYQTLEHSFEAYYDGLNKQIALEFKPAPEENTGSPRGLESAVAEC
jgi:hypothetical protein